ncbi:acetyltransferase [Pseudomonas eucalypticola]|uniref:Acetyltransferase n=1 Tax=Pseudomonas eucalypticola TaxID=2599595 RepID=A0A7D5D712_9PSED|nr:acetyltransferase [Pseudomonas eucalypticola]
MNNRTSAIPALAHGRPQVIQPVDSTTGLDAYLSACEVAFNRQPGLAQVTFSGQPSSATTTLLAEGLLLQTGPQQFTCTAQAFWQNPRPWLPKASHVATPVQYVLTGAVRHPLRPAETSTLLYRRFIPWLGQTLTFDIADPDCDLPAFNRWMNAPRVAHFWEEQGTLEQHHAYLQKLLADPHAQPVIGRFDGIAFGYFETYWAKEDRIAPFYPADDFDRGMHLLVGEEAFRGKAFYTAWFSSLCHYLFLDDPRTRNIVCEPRHDNQRQIANFDRSGFSRIKHFDFPHKRALLVMLSREHFFTDRLYQPLGDHQTQESPA